MTNDVKIEPTSQQNTFLSSQNRDQVGSIGINGKDASVEQLLVSLKMNLALRVSCSLMHGLWAPPKLFKNEMILIPTFALFTHPSLNLPLRWFANWR